MTVRLASPRNPGPDHCGHETEVPEYPFSGFWWRFFRLFPQIYFSFYPLIYEAITPSPFPTATKPERGEPPDLRGIQYYRVRKEDGQEGTARQAGRMIALGRGFLEACTREDGMPPAWEPHAVAA